MIGAASSRERAAGTPRPPPGKHPSWPNPLALLLVLTLCAACSTTDRKKREAQYGPSESVIEVVAVLRRHVPDDTYRFPPARDFTGRNVYRSSLLRLESIERLPADALRTGYMDPVIALAKGRGLERLRDSIRAAYPSLCSAPLECSRHGEAPEGALSALRVD